ncbi:hypothetical protein [Marinobacter salarius]|uniref:Uncharacterized protein n=1 Tax=Marinobacter salarius TaxID=1420917 RepID=A0A1W6K9A4_9GAMM|nr:hypothetical protein [Marinobacter salarius]ARM83991.1 hypothetical protein MARSALSMR5_01913 [Marinobacter salarius]
MSDDKATARKLSGTRMKEESFMRTIYVATPEHGVTVDDLKHPEFWAHVAPQFKPGDLVHVYPEDGSFWAELLVQSTSRAAAKVHVLREYALAKVDEPEDDAEFKLKFAGPHAKWRVERVSDGEVIKDGMTKDGAQAYLQSHIKAMAA